MTASSGVLVEVIELQIECDECGFTGDVDAQEDYETFTLSWRCPCGREEEDNL